MSYLNCQTDLTIVNGSPQCTEWVVVDDNKIGAESLGQILNELSAINDFSLTTIGSLISFYLLIFVLGFTAGTVIRIMKKT